MYIAEGLGSFELTYTPVERPDLHLEFEPSYGKLSILNGSTLRYRHIQIHEQNFDQLYIPLRTVSGSREKIVAIIIIVCSLAFLCYFVYSWVSCYLKKPNIHEHSHRPVRELASGEEKAEDDPEEAEPGYDMRHVQGNV